MRTRVRTCLVLLAILGIAPLAQVSKADAPDGHFLHGQDGVVRDTKTGLVWQRKALAAPTTWQDAQTSCGALEGQGGGWRLPSIKEMQTIIDRSRSNPAVDPRHFDLPAVPFWTSSGYGSGRRAWWVNVAHGTSGYEDVAALHMILCVR